MTTLSQLLKEGRIERVEPDPESARLRLKEAERHLHSARAIAEDDPEGAYALLYDAARKAISAHMLANGFRPKKGEGAHFITGLYAVDAFADPKDRESIQSFEYMRRTRNKAEYATWHVGAQRVQKDLKHAQGIIRAVGRSL